MAPRSYGTPFEPPRRSVGTRLVPGTGRVSNRRWCRIGSGGMTVEELAPGLWRWTGYHPEWKQDVGCVSVETADGLVLVDPLVPPEDPDRFLAALDRDVERAGGVVHVLVTLHYHGRRARDPADASRGAAVWPPARARAAMARRTGEPSDLFRPGDELAGGIRAL